jgi:hypothetical protein
VSDDESSLPMRVQTTHVQTYLVAWVGDKEYHTISP